MAKKYLLLHLPTPLDTCTRVKLECVTTWKHLWTPTSGTLPLEHYLWNTTSGTLPLEHYLWNTISGPLLGLHHVHY
ncbi:hypothetical protein N7501_007226 [Penicillium viridicatum]|nr:hypothetical protein N7501_007226 [Penicillium viridicatum]